LDKLPKLIKFYLFLGFLFFLQFLLGKYGKAENIAFSIIGSLTIPIILVFFIFAEEQLFKNIIFKHLFYFYNLLIILTIVAIPFMAMWREYPAVQVLTSIFPFMLSMELLLIGVILQQKILKIAQFIIDSSLPITVSLVPNYKEQEHISSSTKNIQTIIYDKAQLLQLISDDKIKQVFLYLKAIELDQELEAIIISLNRRFNKNETNLKLHIIELDKYELAKNSILSHLVAIIQNLPFL